MQMPLRRTALTLVLCVSAMPAYAQDHPAVQRLRALLSAQVTLNYHAASPVEGSPDAVRLSGVTLTRGNETISMASLLLDRLTENSAARVEAEGVQGTMDGTPVRVARFQMAGLTYTPTPASAPAVPPPAPVAPVPPPVTRPQGQLVPPGSPPMAPKPGMPGAQAPLAGQPGLPGKPGAQAPRPNVQIPPSPNRPGGMAHADRPMPDAFTLDSALVEGFEVQGTPRVSIARMTVRDYGIGRRSTTLLEGLTVAGIPASPVSDFVMARFTGEGLDLAAWLNAAARDASPPGLPAGRASLNVEGVELSATGAPVGGLERLSVEIATEADQSGTGSIGLRGLRVRQHPLTAPFLTMLDLPGIDASLTMDTTYRAADGHVDIPALAIGVQQLGATALALRLDGWTPEAARNHDPSRMRLLGFRLRQADDGMYDRILRQQAQRAGITADQMRQRHLQMSQAALSAPPGTPEPPGLASLREAVLRFVRGEARTIEVIANPPQPVPMQQMQAAGPQGAPALAQLLGLSGSNP
ncbi:hypothetical protein EOD42_11435 [Rhodovarius crocodyli]|uniref:DUF748 domain-containing protein n=1 Tax=Rhodovarius crocodyli TaxID=1979269 RepID=A0A437MH74_9PROT|nr:hypothetical protein [Rhodovarius crocodyli]RVT96999.1 hypothetical protein EOD42_11435 [Rhodovarius crocodyli]